MMKNWGTWLYIYTEAMESCASRRRLTASSSPAETLGQLASVSASELGHAQD